MFYLIFGRLTCSQQLFSIFSNTPLFATPQEDTPSSSQPIRKDRSTWWSTATPSTKAGWQTLFSTGVASKRSRASDAGSTWRSIWPPTESSFQCTFTTTIQSIHTWYGSLFPRNPGNRKRILQRSRKQALQLHPFHKVSRSSIRMRWLSSSHQPLRNTWRRMWLS